MRNWWCANLIQWRQPRCTTLKLVKIELWDAKKQWVAVIQAADCTRATAIGFSHVIRQRASDISWFDLEVKIAGFAEGCDMRIKRASLVPSMIMQRRLVTIFREFDFSAPEILIGGIAGKVLARWHSRWGNDPTKAMLIETKVPVVHVVVIAYSFWIRPPGIESWVVTKSIAMRFRSLLLGFTSSLHSFGVVHCSTRAAELKAVTRGMWIDLMVAA